MSSPVTNSKDFVVDFYPKPDHEVRYCAIAHYAETLLTNSVYVLNCNDAFEAMEKAERFFSQWAGKSVICKTVVSIEILPKNAGRWSEEKPELIRKY